MTPRTTTRRPSRAPFTLVPPDPRSLAVERRVGPETFEALRELGHDVEAAAPWSLGRVCAVSRAPDGVLRGAADPRGMQAYACGR